MTELQDHLRVYIDRSPFLDHWLSNLHRWSCGGGAGLLGLPGSMAGERSRLTSAIPLPPVLIVPTLGAGGPPFFCSSPVTQRPPIFTPLFIILCRRVGFRVSRSHAWASS